MKNDDFCNSHFSSRRMIKNCVSSSSQKGEVMLVKFGPYVFFSFYSLLFKSVVRVKELSKTSKKSGMFRRWTKKTSGVDMVMDKYIYFFKLSGRRLLSLEHTFLFFYIELNKSVIGMYWDGTLNSNLFSVNQVTKKFCHISLLYFLYQKKVVSLYMYEEDV